MRLGLAFAHHPTPSVKGLATIHDKDIVIYCISQLVAKMNAGQPLHKTLHLKAHDLLVSTNRNTDGRGYQQLEDALERLSGTRIKTNIKTNKESIREGFGLIDSWRIIRNTKSDRMSEIAINLSDWVFNAVLGRDVLTLHRGYFRLRKPLERRIYELGRKHCGKQDEWAISLELLKKKCGSASEDAEFRRLVGIICKEDEQHGHIPDYALSFDGDMIRFVNRQTMKALPAPEAVLYPQIRGGVALNLIRPSPWNLLRIHNNLASDGRPKADSHQKESQWNTNGFPISEGIPKVIR